MMFGSSQTLPASRRARSSARRTRLSAGTPSSDAIDQNIATGSGRREPSQSPRVPRSTPMRAAISVTEMSRASMSARNSTPRAAERGSGVYVRAMTAQYREWGLMPTSHVVYMTNSRDGKHLLTITSTVRPWGQMPPTVASTPRTNTPQRGGLTEVAEQLPNHITATPYVTPRALQADGTRITRRQTRGSHPQRQ